MGDEEGGEENGAEEDKGAGDRPLAPRGKGLLADGPEARLEAEEKLDVRDDEDGWRGVSVMEESGLIVLTYREA
jgi:hypothetical protein